MTPDSFAFMPALLVAAVVLSALLAWQAGKAAPTRPRPVARG